MTTDEKQNYMDLYDDFDNFDLGLAVEKLKSENQILRNEIQSRNNDIEKLANALTEMKTVNENLTNNISSLFLTAKTEIARKDNIIADLRRERDNFAFRRQGHTFKNQNRISQNNDTNLEVKNHVNNVELCNRTQEKTICTNANLHEQNMNCPLNKETEKKHTSTHPNIQKPFKNSTEKSFRTHVDLPVPNYIQNYGAPKSNNETSGENLFQQRYRYNTQTETEHNSRGKRKYWCGRSRYRRDEEYYRYEDNINDNFTNRKHNSQKDERSCATFNDKNKSNDLEEPRKYKSTKNKKMLKVVDKLENQFAMPPRSYTPPFVESENQQAKVVLRCNNKPENNFFVLQLDNILDGIKDDIKVNSNREHKTSNSCISNEENNRVEHARKSDVVKNDLEEGIQKKFPDDVSTTVTKKRKKKKDASDRTLTKQKQNKKGKLTVDEIFGDDSVDLLILDECESLSNNEEDGNFEGNPENDIFTLKSQTKQLNCSKMNANLLLVKDNSASYHEIDSTSNKLESDTDGVKKPQINELDVIGPESLKKSPENTNNNKMLEEICLKFTKTGSNLVKEANAQKIVIVSDVTVSPSKVKTIPNETNHSPVNASESEVGLMKIDPKQFESPERCNYVPSSRSTSKKRRLLERYASERKDSKLSDSVVEVLPSNRQFVNIDKEDVPTKRDTVKNGSAGFKRKCEENRTENNPPKIRKVTFNISKNTVDDSKEENKLDLTFSTDKNELIKRSERLNGQERRKKINKSPKVSKSEKRRHSNESKPKASNTKKQNRRGSDGQMSEKAKGCDEGFKVTIARLKNKKDPKIYSSSGKNVNEQCSDADQKELNLKVEPVPKIVPQKVVEYTNVDTKTIFNASNERTNVLSGQLLEKTNHENRSDGKSSIPDHSNGSRTSGEPSKPRKRIKPTPIKDAPVCTFKNILERNDTIKLFSKNVAVNAHFAEEGDIPILHLEEISFSNMEEGTQKTFDKSIMRLLDGLNDTDCDTSKLIDKEREKKPPSKENLTFENVIETVTSRTSNVDLDTISETPPKQCSHKMVTSTPIVKKCSSEITFTTTKDDQNNDKMVNSANKQIIKPATTTSGFRRRCRMVAVKKIQ